ncbi:MAG: RNA polymerase sporulation sigma factor SigH [Clostridiales bacterium]|nr:RNA polymerase sporulation sigma factor SigH [Clostridiales bacterium]
MDSKYAEMADELLVKQAQAGDAGAEEYLIRKYKDLVRGKAHFFFIVGADNEDTVQEGMIGIFKAIKGYSEEKSTTFQTFAEICINRQILSAIKAAQRQKHAPLNNSLSISNPLSGGDDKTIEDTLLSCNYDDPEALYILKEDLNRIEDSSVFSDMELRVWNEYLKGRTYSEIGQIINKTPKAVDNAIQRTKRKLEDCLGLGK